MCVGVMFDFVVARKAVSCRIMRSVIESVEESDRNVAIEEVESEKIDMLTGTVGARVRIPVIAAASSRKPMDSRLARRADTSTR